MSRIGKAPITVPSGVDVQIDDRTITVKGPKGTLSREIPGEIDDLGRGRRAHVHPSRTTSATSVPCTG